MSTLGNSEITGMAGFTGIMKLTKEGVFVSTAKSENNNFILVKLNFFYFYFYIFLYEIYSYITDVNIYINV